MRWIGFTLAYAAIVVACGGSSITVGGPCTNGEQGCSDNKEFNCESGKWKLAKDCNPTGKACSVDKNGDADCR